MDHHVTHATFTLERSYPVPPARVFAAWADPAAKARWFTPNPDFGHELDFRVGGREVATGAPEGGPVMTFETLYRDIVPDERIVYTSTLSAGEELMTVSLTVWLDGALYFSTGQDEQKSVNLRANPHVLLLTGCHRWDEGLDVVAEGRAARVTDVALLTRLAQAWAAKWDGQWQFEVRDGAFWHPGGGTALVFEVRPAKVLAFAKGHFGQTRHSFA